MNPPKIVLLLPISRSNLTRKYVEGIKILIASPVIKRLIIINKTSDNLDGLISIFRKQVNDLDYVILSKDRNTGIFEGFLGLLIDKDEWIMQIHDDDWAKGEIHSFNPTSQYYYFVPKKLEEESLFLRSRHQNQWVFSAISSFFWNMLLAYFDFMEEAPLPSSDFTLNTLIMTLGIRKQFNDYSYHYSSSNWNLRAKHEHLQKILIQNGWGEFSNSRVATLNMKIDALAFSAFVFSRVNHQDVKSRLQKSIRLQEIEILKSLSRFYHPTWKSKLSQLTRISEKVSQSELDYFACFFDVNSIGDLTGAFAKLEHLHIPALAKRANLWSELITSIGEQCES